MNLISESSGGEKKQQGVKLVAWLLVSEGARPAKFGRSCAFRCWFRLGECDFRVNILV
jgi:hypothetical protein